jgi:hypothetical protein
LGSNSREGSIFSVSEIIIGSNKLFNLVGFNITFLRLNVVIMSTSLLLGFLIYTKENVNISRIIQLENNLDETFWVQIHAKGQSFLLCNTYRPQWACFVSDTTYIDITQGNGIIVGTVD